METSSERRLETLTEALGKLTRRGAWTHVSRMLSKLRPGDVALLIRDLTPSERFGVFSVLIERFPDTAGDVLAELAPAQRSELLAKLSANEIAGLLKQVPVDDAVFIVESLPSELQEDVVALVDLRRDLDEVQAHLTYDDDTAGRIMDTGFFALSESTTVREAIEAIQGEREVEMIFYLYVVDAAGALVGVVSLRQLLLTNPSRTLGDIMQRDVITVETSTDQEEVARLTARYDLLAIPVTDEAGKLVGIVTVDDVVDVVKDEATEDFFKIVGSSDDELVYQERAFRVARIRIPWLLFNLVGLLLTGVLLTSFQVSFTEAIFLLTFVPVVMGMGGNTGSQTSTLTVRGLATGRLELGRGVARYLLQQIKVGALIGLTCGVVVAGASLVLNSNPFYALVVGLALFFALILSCLIGAMIPLFFEKVGVDPAVAAGPLVTTTSDITGILIYFGLAGLLIQQLVR